MALAQYLLVVKKSSKEEAETIMKPLFDDLHQMEKRKIGIRRLYNNYDAHMYMTHQLKYGVSKYVEFVFDNDKYDHRSILMNLLIRDKIIETDTTSSNDFFRFIDDKVILLLKYEFMWREGDNNSLNDRAIILNLKAINVLRPFPPKDKE